MPDRDLKYPVKIYANKGFYKAVNALVQICRKAMCRRVSVLGLGSNLNCRTESHATKPSHHFCARGWVDFLRRHRYAATLF